MDKIENEFDFLNKIDVQKRIDELADLFKGKKILLYGAGKLFQKVYCEFDFSKLNIIGISDIKFTEDNNEDFMGIKCISPSKISETDYDIILTTVLSPAKVVKYLFYELSLKNTRIVNLFKNENLIIELNKRNDKVVKIGPEDKILFISPHPDDEVISCGGFIAKYNKQIDMFCPNSSGIKYSDDTLTAQEIADNRIKTMTEVAKSVGIENIYVKKIWFEKDGKESAFDKMEKSFEDYINNIDVSEYDIILVPHKTDDHPSHMYVGNILLKKMLKKQGFKENLKIMRYELWSTIEKPNYYEDITDFVEAKKELIYAYGERGEKYFNRIIALNKYRTIKPYLFNEERFVEAFYVEDVKTYLNEPEIINKTTDKDFHNEEFEQLLKEQNAQEKINKLSEICKNKKVVLYGAGAFARCVFKNYDLSKFNIIAIADKKFEQEKAFEFYGLNCIKPEQLKHFDYDIILISNQNYDYFSNILVKDMKILTYNENLKIYPLVKLKSDNKFFSDFLERADAQTKIDKIAKRYKNKKIALYGAGQFSNVIFQNYDLSKLNIVAVADRKFKSIEEHFYYNLKCIEPTKLKDIDCDVILISNFEYSRIYDSLDTNILYGKRKESIEIRPLIELNFKDMFL